MFRVQIRKAIEEVVPEGTVFSVERPALTRRGRPENPEHGDYSSNAALVLAKTSHQNKLGARPSPKEVAEDLKAKIVKHSASNIFERIDIAGPGFLNFWIKKEALLKALGGEIKFAKKKDKISLDYLDANPTGPIHIGHARSGFLGDVLANVLERAGYKVSREFYVNNAKVNTQIRSLGKTALGIGGEYKHAQLFSLLKKPEVKKKLAKIKEESDAGFYIASLIQKENARFLKEKAKIKFDLFFEEESVYSSGLLRKILEGLIKSKAAYEKDGAMWLRASKYGDSEDRVVVRSGGEPTYVLADVAYHWDRMVKRKFDQVINIFGADHYGYGPRLKAALAALGIDPKRIKIIGIQTARLLSKGREVKMSKRKGEFVTLEELIDKVGLDAARWFFLERSPDTHMDFDLDLAREQSKKNPVYYVQYAAARCSSILRKSQIPKSKFQTNSKFQILTLLNKTEELNLIKKILQLPEVIEDIASDYQVHRLPRYAYELAKILTDFYEKHRVVDAKDVELTRARLALVSATRKTLEGTLSLMGIAAPERM